MGVRTIVLLLAACLATPAIDFHGEEAPRFRARTLDGESFDNASLKGKVVLIQFWTTWCRYCRGDQPAVDGIASKYKDKDLVVLAVSVNESRSTVRKYLDSNPRTAKVVLGENTNLPAVFETRGFPIYIVLDRNGKVAARHEGAAGPSLSRLLASAGLE